jgi:hypothetical protein
MTAKTITDNGNVGSSTSIDGSSTKRKVGRPREWTEERLVALGEGLIEWLNEADENIFLDEYLVKNDLYAELLSQQIDTSNEFAQLIKKAKKIQESKIAKFAFSGKKNPVFGMFLLKCKHGYSEYNTLTVSHLNASPVNVFLNLPVGKTPDSIQIPFVEIPPELLPKPKDDTNETQEP